MTISGAMAGVAGLGLAAADMSGWRHPLIYVGALFLLYAAHTGVRNGRKTHIVDIATADTRAAYVAVSNTIIGAALAMSAAVGWAVSLLGDYAALLFFSACALIGAILSWRLTEAQAR